LNSPDPEPAIDSVFRDDERLARSGGDINTRALTDEVITEAFDLDVRDDAALFDLWIDQNDPAPS
jgi:hypothetical protein